MDIILLETNIFIFFVTINASFFVHFSSLTLRMWCLTFASARIQNLESSCYYIVIYIHKNY